MLRRCCRRLCFGLPVAAMETPNPDCLQYRTPNDEVLPGDITVDVPMRSLSHVHPLSQMIFDQYEQEIRSVFLARHYVTVTKWSDVRWTGLLERGIGGLIGHYVFLNDPIAPLAVGAATNVHEDITIRDTDSEAVQCIKELLRTEIKPMVQRDGGDVRFVGFDVATGVVSLQMLGACKTCPSSRNTLKDGIERMMRHFVEEVKEVVEVKVSDAAERESRKVLDAEARLGSSGTVSGGKPLGNYEFTPNPHTARHPLEREAAIHLEEAERGKLRDDERIRTVQRQQEQRRRLGRRVMSMEEMMEPDA